MTAACVAAGRGRDVLVLESSHQLGGTTAVAGGVLWAPGSHLMRQAGVQDSAEETRTYLRTVSRGSMADTTIDWFIDIAPKTISYLVDKTLVRLASLPRPDYHSDAAGAKESRSLDNLPFDVRAHTGLEDRLLNTLNLFQAADDHRTR